MKFFSLNFTVNKSDYDAYYKDFGKGLVLNQFKRSAVTLLFMIVMLVLYRDTQIEILAVTVAFIGIMLLLSNILQNETNAFLYLEKKI